MKKYEFNFDKNNTHLRLKILLEIHGGDYISPTHWGSKFVRILFMNKNNGANIQLRW